MTRKVAHSPTSPLKATVSSKRLLTTMQTPHSCVTATSEGGYGGDPFSRRAQRGLVEQSPNGGPIGNELQDAKQGRDLGSREEYRREQGAFHHLHTITVTC